MPHVNKKHALHIRSHGVAAVQCTTVAYFTSGFWYLLLFCGSVAAGVVLSVSCTIGRPSCSRSARGSPVRALRGRGSRRSPLLAPSPLPGFLRDLALRARVRCRCTLRCAAAREEEGRPRRPCFELPDLCCTSITRRRTDSRRITGFAELDCLLAVMLCILD